MGPSYLVGHYDWVDTQDHRIIAYNLTWKATFNGQACPTHGAYEWTGSASNYLDRYSNTQVFLARDYFACGPDDSWNVEVSGNIYQWLPNDYPEHEYEVVGYPLW